MSSIFFLKNYKKALTGDTKFSTNKWIEGKLDGGFPVPKPIDESRYSGKFVLRIPKSLHARLAIEAEKEGVSLNQYALYRLSM